MALKGFRRVPAIDKCFAVLDLLIQSEEPLGISEISSRLDLNKSTVFNINHTLKALQILENRENGKFVLGTRFYVLANMAAKRSRLVQIAHPYLDRIVQQTRFSAFLGVRSGSRTTLIDKTDNSEGFRISSEIGMEMPTLAGAGIKAMLSLLPERELDRILSTTDLVRYTPLSILDKKVYKEEVLGVRKRGIAYDLGEYIEGMVGFAVPIAAYGGDDVQAAIWMVGFKSQVDEAILPSFRNLLLGVARDINHRLQ